MAPSLLVGKGAELRLPDRVSEGDLLFHWAEAPWPGFWRSSLNAQGQKEVVPGKELPGGPVVRTLSFHCRKHGFNP